MLTVNTNLSSLILQNNLAKSTNALNEAIERMTTGFKINHAADNAAGYSIANTMDSQISSYTVAEDNASMGLDMVQTAMDSMTLVSDHLTRIRDLAEQASNGTYGEQSLQAINSEVQARVAEINRIIANTEFNGIQLLDGGGVDPNGVTGKFLAPVEQLTEEEAIAQGYTVIKTKDDLENIKNNMSGKYILMNDIDLENSCLSYSTSDYHNTFTGELNGNGHVIRNLKVDSNSQFAGLFGFATAAKFINLGLENVDIKTTYNEGEAGGLFAVSGRGNNQVTNVYVSGQVYSAGRAGGIISYANDILTDCYSDCLVTASNQPGAIFNSISGTNFNNVYYNIEKTASAGSSGSSEGITGVTAAELDALLIKPEGDGTTVQFQVGIYDGESSKIDVALGGLGMSNFALSFTTSDNARNALSTIDGYLERISSKQTEFGAVYNRLESAIESIGVSIENLTSSLSTIRDADIAKESSNYIKSQILQQASATLLATANQSPSIALQLI